jgi:hypothetical protein
MDDAVTIFGLWLPLGYCEVTIIFDSRRPRLLKLPFLGNYRHTYTKTYMKNYTREKTFSHAYI